MTEPYARTTDAFRRSLDGADALSRSMAAAARTGQTIGIEWADCLKQFGTEAAAAAGTIAKAGSPAEAIALHGAFVQASGALWAARAATIRGLYAALARDMMTPFTVPAGRDAA